MMLESNLCYPYTADLGKSHVISLSLWETAIEIDAL